ncbi:Transmembrane protein 243 like protein [Argiope bruennichi]|uniref:Transmembrane protein 243 like protein n=1 Tax=Argiope bruennichi TaxID=94029 RepID=A0A8T0E256_ARGBR|nr:Transmembrane protein 243 like protein [Argiope bruennichi]
MESTSDEYRPLFGGIITDKPLFGVTNTRDRVINVFVGCVTGLIFVIYWYRQGDLDPKFRLLIYYNAFTMILLSTCALSFFFTEK